MKTIARLLAIVTVLAGSGHAQIPKATAVTGDQAVPKNKANAAAGKSLAVSAAVMSLAKKAREQYERGNYKEARALYDRALTKAPNHLYLLSNKAVVLFRMKEYQAAGKTLRKTIALHPDDAFCRSLLGIVQYQLGKSDVAGQSPNQADDLTPRRKGAPRKRSLEFTVKELQQALEIDPNYGDAHFNLAVLLALQDPPDQEAARKHYERALELGAEPDQALERMIKTAVKK